MLPFVIRLFEPCFRWTGRIDRRTFYGSTLVLFVPAFALSALASVPLALLAALLKLNSFSGAIDMISALVTPALGIMLMSAVISQRAHDIGRSPAIFYGALILSLILGGVMDRSMQPGAALLAGWQYAMLVIAAMPGPIAFFVLVFQPGQTADNKFGPPPKQV